MTTNKRISTCKQIVKRRGILVFPYNKILVPYDGSRPSENALQQAIQILACGGEASNPRQGRGIQIILLHVVEEIHIRIPNVYIGLRIIAGKPLKEFFKEVYEEISNEASKMLDDIKKRIESAIQITSNKRGTKLSPMSITIIPQVVIGNPAKVIIDIANNKQRVDLIIMGSTSLKGISKVRALGSISRQVCENSNCPVMLVH
jgi:nucleotide-binding universal stress UspA family protein